MTGFGTFAFGLAPFGGMGPTSTLTAASTTVKALPLSARKLVGGDYVLASNGRLTQAEEPLLQEAAIRLGLIRGSIIGAPTLGNEVVLIRSFTTTSPVEIINAVDTALAPMVERGAIKNVVVTPSPYVLNGTAVCQYAVSFEPTGRVQ